MTSLKKSIAVLALSLPLAASAQQAAAPAPLYQIYGTLNVNGQYIEVSDPTTGANMPGRLAISTDSTNVGIRGTADTGQFGLGVVYQCETSAAVDGDAGSTLCNRNSRLGVTGNFGTLFYGNWDTPLKALLYGTKADDPFGNTDVYDVAAIMGSPGNKTRSNAGRTAGAAAPQGSFNIRAANSIAYHSPKFEGAQLKAQYSVAEYSSASAASRGGNDFAPALYSIGLNYERGPFSVAVAYERHDDWAGANQGATQTTKDQGVKAGAGIELASGFGTTTVGLQVDWLSYAVENPAPNAFEDASRIAYMIGLKHRTGNHELRLRFSQALEADVNLKGATPTPNPGDKTGATNFALGYAYYLSKAAQVYAYATMLQNDDAAAYTFATAGPTSLTSVNWGAGADLFAAGVGMRYAF